MALILSSYQRAEVPECLTELRDRVARRRFTGATRRAHVGRRLSVVGSHLLILDNVSTLCAGTGPENEAASWEPIQAWRLEVAQDCLTQRKIEEQVSVRLTTAWRRTQDLREEGLLED